jgi:hypothetical protein
MRRFQIRMTFEGYASGATTHEAIAEFKSQLGLAPEALRSESHMTAVSVMEIPPPAEDPVEQLENA